MTITCLNCDGRGWMPRTFENGWRHPVLCGGCFGSGAQEVIVPEEFVGRVVLEKCAAGR